MSSIFKALADPTRRTVLELLKGGPMRAGDISGHFEVSNATMSGHLAILREAGLVTSEKQGKSVIYQLQMSVLEDGMMAFLNGFGIKLGHHVEEQDGE